ncbi:DUF4124 domain-containing protein [Massilia sp. CFBP 13647]|uniref:DUF4124 domain-containing protein n=1 Tax=Massilia sp. CFBP 13721 TaxID=2775300 RepID=UPI001780A1A9|nr:DUF4124 domain-containing protein [Massilia sp. CFBP 13721]MBD8529641.1 DUF4124 domain-containing protein [Massilia sp. CFBP 13647]
MNYRVLAPLVLAWCALPAAAQQLPPPSRTMYKCTDNNVVSYSDKPCLGAERLVVVPTRGVNKLSGKERIGRDVQQEHHREQFAEALRPISGMKAAQFEVYSRRIRLSSAAQNECRHLDPVLMQTEALEAAADKAGKPAVQRDLFVLRTRYVALGC